MAPQVAEEDLQRVAQATGAAVQTTVNGLDPRVLGSCRHFEEVQARRADPGASFKDLGLSRGQQHGCCEYGSAWQLHHG